MKINTLLAVSAFAATAFLSLPFNMASAAESQLSLEQRITQLEQQAKTRGLLQTNMSIQLNELQNEVKELRGIIEEHDYKLEQIQERQRDIYRDIEDRLSGVHTNATDNTNPQELATNTTDSVVSPQVTEQVKQTITDSDDGRSEFDAAFKLVRNRQYPQAIQGFESFLAKYPSGDFSDNARFWIGQVYYAQSNLIEAEKQFLLLRSDFPDSSKMSAAILKLAEIKVKQQQWNMAKKLYNEVLSQYTGAPQQLARKGLQDIKQAGH